LGLQGWPWVWSGMGSAHHFAEGYIWAKFEENIVKDLSEYDEYSRVTLSRYTEGFCTEVNIQNKFEDNLSMGIGLIERTTWRRRQTDWLN
jgi:hypothetical protein